MVMIPATWKTAVVVPSESARPLAVSTVSA